MEQRINLKFLAKLVKTPSECFALLQQVYKEETMSRACAFEWHKRFREGREECEDYQRSGRPATKRTDSNIDRVKQLVHADRQLTVRMICDELSIGRDAVWKTLSENLKMRKLCAKMVPKIFSEYQRQQKFTVCLDITKHLEAKPDLLNSVIAGDETWVFEYNPETKRQSREWKSYGSPRPMRARKSKSKVKVMLIVFFDIQGIDHFKFLPQDQTVNQTVYKEIFWRLVRSVGDKRRSLWEANTWALHHDNAPTRTALSISQFLAERNIATLEHPSYFPDLAPRDFFLFPKIKSVLKGTHFSDIDSIKKAVTTELKKIPENVFQEYFESLKKRMHKCLRVEGEYFEGV